MSALDHLAGKSVLVSGAGGSIGSELCRQISRSAARRLVLLSLTESALYNIERGLRKIVPPGMSIVPVLGNVADTSLMAEVLQDVDIVVHAAAHKHVPICQSNPLAAIENNIGGTYRLASAAAAAGVSQFVLISTDKAVRPASVMGATKRVAELILRDTFHGHTTRFITVRFGNVLDSAGSVMPLWREQIHNGGPLTLTDPGCERYFMSIPQAVDLILDTASMNANSGTFVLDMGKPQRLLEIAQRMIAESGRDIEIQFIGLRPGEKLTEELHFGGELVPTSNAKIFRVEEQPKAVLDRCALLALLEAVTARDKERAMSTLMAMAA
jgi:FlaA1/EpsC-like NDP-sugar epimerase